MNAITITPTIELETELTQAEAIEAFQFLIKMPQIDDPEWIAANPTWKEDGLTPPQINKFTNMGLFEDYIEGHIMAVINNGLKAKAKADAPKVKRK